MYHRHNSKKEFNLVATSVVALEVMAFVIFIVGISLSVYNIFVSRPFFDIKELILVVLGVTMTSFLLLSFGEFLQLLMKIEVNTRKSERVLERIEKVEESKMPKIVTNVEPKPSTVSKAAPAPIKKGPVRGRPAKKA